MRTSRRGRRPRRFVPTAALLLALVPSALPARADAGPTAAATSAATKRPFSPRGATATSRPTPGAEGSGGWWLGTAGIALALAACGWMSVAARRYLPGASLATGSARATLRVVGRTSLSPRHTVYLLDVGDRVLIVGTGPQGAPSLLGEMSGPDSPERPSPQGVVREAPAPSARFDQLLGDEA